MNKQEQSMRSLCTTYLCSFVHLFFCPFSTVIFWLFTGVVSFVPLFSLFNYKWREKECVNWIKEQRQQQDFVCRFVFVFSLLCAVFGKWNERLDLSLVPVFFLFLIPVTMKWNVSVNGNEKEERHSTRKTGPRDLLCSLCSSLSILHKACGLFLPLPLLKLKGNTKDKETRLTGGMDSRI